MAYKDLEKRLKGSGNWSDVEKILERTKGDDKFHTILQYVFAIASDLQAYKVQNYGFIGGYGILLHLMNSVGGDSAEFWRGSYDIDLVAEDYNLENALQNEYLLRKAPSRLTPGKFTAELQDLDLNERCPLDLFLLRGHRKIMLERYRIGSDFLTKVQYITLYGITFPVLEITELLKMKLEVQKREELPRLRDRIDIYHILAILERQRTPSETYRKLTKFQRDRLRKILLIPQSQVERMNLIIEPSRRYVIHLRQVLKS